MSTFTSRRSLSMSFTFSCTSRWLRICRLFSMSFLSSTGRRSWSFSVSCFRTSIYCRSFSVSFLSSTSRRSWLFSMSTFTSSRVSWSYGGIFTFGCTSRWLRICWSFSMSTFTSSWVCRLFSMSFFRFIRLSFIMFRLLFFTVFICVNDIFT